MQQLPEMNFEELRNLGLIDESEFRNLADQFFLSPESIHGIYYRKREKQRMV